ncbi:MAG: hypothetical protein OXJ55_14810 [Caldilineaceae bacterium]|nr:hypothetical protein [Caldilineaceae bacterium]
MAESDLLDEILSKVTEATKPAAKAAGTAWDGIRRESERVLEEGSKSYRASKRDYEELTTAVTDSTRVPAWYILAGLGTLNRRSLCEFLAVFECVSLVNLIRGSARDLFKRLSGPDQADGRRAFERRVQDEAEQYYRSKDRRDSDTWLRFRLWSRLRSAQELAPSLPLSCQMASSRCVETADRAAQQYSGQRASAGRTKGLGRKMGNAAADVDTNVRTLFSADRKDFTQAVRREATATVLQALQSDELPTDQRELIAKEFQSRLDALPEELRDHELEQAVKNGDWATVATFAAAGSLAGLAITVEIAGFSAYIVAAQLSAVIPFLGGQTAVSLLAVLADPIFTAAALLGGGWYMNRSLTRKIVQGVASNLAIQLALQGLSARSDGLKVCLDGFKGLELDRHSESDKEEARLAWHRERVGPLLGFMPETPGAPDASLPELSQMRGADALSKVLFPDSKAGIPDEGLIAGLTVAEILFDAAAIDPRVVAATDFSNAEAIDSIFQFGAFAERVQDMEGMARVGAESHLRGFVAELVVATRLSDYDVSLADSPNTPGYDLLVDGNPFQVKCYGDPSAGMAALEDHFARYPDIPVFVNSELLPAVQVSGEAWVDSVFGVEGFDYAHTDEIVQESLASGADLVDLSVPVFAIAVSAARNVHSWWKGSISLKDLPFEIAVDAALHGTLTVAGGFTGSAVGLLLFGPAGRLILTGIGEIGAITLHRKARQKFDEVWVKEWTAALGQANEEFRQALRAAMILRIQRTLAKVARLEVSDYRLDAWMRSRFHDRALSVAECVAELDDLPENPTERTKALLRLMSEARVHQRSVSDPLKELTAVLARRPGLYDRLHELVKAGDGESSAKPAKDVP